ncbi:MAG TPA: Ldh family oxidoreductase [Williamwhitmania sp.]|nr:Ldh family oxidoreductase [Williamwhitmania sp.]
MYTHQYLEEFTTQLFEKMGCPTADAKAVAELLIRAELRGLSSHGMMRVKDYFLLVEAGRINTKPNVHIVHETPSTATVDGDNALGPVAAKRSMEIAIEKAKNVGTGWVATKGSNHFGIAGYYAMMALEHDMVGISMTNANPLVAPTNSTSKFLGTNPIAVAFPTQHQPAFVADFATTPIARGKLAIMGKKGQSIDYGFVQDKHGNPSTNPDILLDGGAILPLGGSADHGSHKGYCMGSLIDIFSSVFSGANFGPFVPPQVAYLPLLEKSVGEGLGHFFGAMRIDAFRPASEFKMKMDEWIETFRGAESIQGQPKVMIPGDPERLNEERITKEGITLIAPVIKDLADIASKLNVPFRAE